jgi:nucleoid-associated protein YgaU
MVDAAIEQYKRRENTDDYREEMKTFRKDHSPYVVASDEEEHCRARITHKTGLPRLAITYLGVWDTVGALGIPTRYSWLSWINKKHKFHDTELSKFVKRARHAVAIDERRKDFEPTLWSNLDEMNADANVPADEDLPYRERWFPGVHSSVGGGGDRRGLADQALDWVLDGARAAGLVLDADQHSTIYRLKPDYTEYIESSSDAGIFYKAMSKLAVADRLPGPKNLKQVSTSAKRRWLEQPSSLKDRFQYRPKTLNSVQKELDALNPADYGIREKDDPAQKYELYQVQRGDTLSSIAKNSYGHAGDYVRIYRANLHKLDSKDRIYPGQLLRIPRP